MKRLPIFIVVMTAVLLAVTVAQGETIQAALAGKEEVPVVATVASGEFRGFINRGDQSIDYALMYSDLQGTVTQGHIHIAQPSVNGSIVVWLCQTATNVDPTGLAPQCPQEGTVSGTITTANVIAGSMGGQQLAAGDLAEVVRAIRAGNAYVNVHTNLSPGGEVRGQLRGSSRR